MENKSVEERAHNLKTWPEYFQAIKTGQKTFEARINDRGFIVGDILILEEYDIRTGYTGDKLRRRIGYILEGMGLPDGMVVMSLEPQAARQDQGVVGTQGREAYFQSVFLFIESEDYKSAKHLFDFMRANWPVSEGEGMNGWISVENRLPDEILCCFWCRVPVVEPPHVGSLIDDNFPDPRLEYYTHWKKIENTFFPQPLPSPPQNQK